MASTLTPPPTLPISTPTAAQAQPPIAVASPALDSFLTRLSYYIQLRFAQRRPWSELTDRASLSRPDSLSEATSRLRKNLSYFRVNYISLVAFVLALSLISHPLSLSLFLCLIAAWLFLYLFRPSDQPLVLLGRTFADRETLGLLVVSTIVVVFLTDIGSLLISALLIGLAVVCTHGAFRVTDDLFVDEQEPVNVGFLSFLGGAAAAPAPTPRVT